MGSRVSILLRSVPKPVARRLSVSSVAGGVKRGSGTEVKSSEAPPITLHVDSPELVSKLEPFIRTVA